MPSMLAEADWGSVIGIIVVVIFWVIGAIGKAAQDKKSQQTRRPSTSDRSDTHNSAGDRAKTVRQRLNELAEQRRRQLQEIARQKQSDHERSERPLAPPLNTTTAQPTTSREQVTDVTRRREDAERQAEALRRQQAQQAEQAQAAERRAAEQARRQQLEAQRAAAERQRRLQQQAARLERQRMAVDSSQPGHMEGEVHRHVADAEMPLENIPVHPSLITTREGLRQAIIMKEVLDKPLAMRDPSDLPAAW